MTADTLTPEFAAAFVAACGELVDVDKGKTADAGGYRYRYADLAAVLSDVRPVLARHGLAVVQEVETASLDGGGSPCRCAPSSCTRRPACTAPRRCAHRAIRSATVGSAITYARRYWLMATLGIAADRR